MTETEVLVGWAITFVHHGSQKTLYLSHRSDTESEFWFSSTKYLRLFATPDDATEYAESLMLKVGEVYHVTMIDEEVEYTA